MPGQHSWRGPCSGWEAGSWPPSPGSRKGPWEGGTMTSAGPGALGAAEQAEPQSQLSQEVGPPPAPGHRALIEPRSPALAAPAEEKLAPCPSDTGTRAACAPGPAPRQWLGRRRLRVPEPPNPGAAGAHSVSAGGKEGRRCTWQGQATPRVRGAMPVPADSRSLLPPFPVLSIHRAGGQG